jgi:hypothetical protein
MGAFGWDQINLNSGQQVRKYESNNNKNARESKIVQYKVETRGGGQNNKMCLQLPSRGVLDVEKLPETKIK